MNTEIDDDHASSIASLADSLDTAIDATDLRTVHALVVELRRLVRSLQHEHGLPVGMPTPTVDLWTTKIAEAWSGDPDDTTDDDETVDELDAVRAAYTEIRDRAIQACDALGSAASRNSSGTTPALAADASLWAAVYLEAALGYYRAWGRFPDSYGGTLEELHDLERFEWLQQAIARLAE